MSEILLCSVGASSLVVPEAVLLASGKLDEVWCLTSDSDTFDEAPIRAFFDEQAPAVLKITRVAGFVDLTGPDEQRILTEALYRWYLAAIEKGSGMLPQVCLSGGFKTMSAVLQKAAHLFGARSLFHVLAEDNPKTLEAMLHAHRHGRIRRIDLGAEPGWLALRRLSTREYPLLPVDGGRAWKPKEQPSLREAVDKQLREHADRARGWELRDELPFMSLALRAPEELNWLRAPLHAVDDREWLQRIPKVELHCHLGGFATHGEDLAYVREPAGKLQWPAEPAQPKGWPHPANPIPLNEYRALGDANGSQLLSDPGCLERQCRLLYQRFLAENVTYAEVRCSPNNYTRAGRTAWEVLQAIRQAFEDGMRDAREKGQFFCQVNLIVIATRKPGGDLSDIARHLALAVTAVEEAEASEGGIHCRVVGVDLAGQESPETRPERFAEQFSIAHRCGLAITAHAGENDDAESIWQAVYRLAARRIGHGLCLHDAPDLLRTVIERGIGVEMCPYANFQIAGFQPMKGRPPYPLLDYLRKGVRVSVNTDNIGISAATLTDNLAFLPSLCPGIRRLDILKLQHNAIETAFLSPTARARLRARHDEILAALTTNA